MLRRIVQGRDDQGSEIIPLLREFFSTIKKPHSVDMDINVVSEMTIQNLYKDTLKST